MAKSNRGTLITGKSGMGKSWLEGYLIEGAERPTIIIDPKGEHVGLTPDFLLLNAPLFHQAKDLGLHAFWQRALDKWPRLRVQPTGIDLEEGQELIGALAEVIYARGHINFVAGEYHRFAPNAGSDLGRTPKGLTILHTDARSNEINWLVSSQRPALCNTTVVTQANTRITFMMDDPNDIARVAGFFDAVDGVPARQAIPALRQRDFLIRDSNTGQQQRLSTNSLNRRIAHHG